MSMPFVTGVSVRKLDAFDHFVINVRVRNDFKQWAKLPSFLSEMSFDETNENKGNLLATFSVMEETNDGKFREMRLNDTPVIACIVRENFHIASLKPPSNMIKPTKIHGLSY